MIKQESANTTLAAERPAGMAERMAVKIPPIPLRRIKDAMWQEKLAAEQMAKDGACDDSFISRDRTASGNDPAQSSSDESD
jgi:hypothetical protein